MRSSARELLSIGEDDASTEDPEEEAELLNAPVRRPLYTEVPLEDNIYDAVLISAFGGVLWSQDKEHAPRYAHPVMIFTFALLVYSIQSAIVLFLRLDLDFTAQVTNDGILALKMLLVVVVQLSFYNRIYGSCRTLFFSLNPFTWNDIVRPDGGTWRRVFVAPVSCVALICRFLILDKVAEVSTSIILADASVKESVFDCLAIEFISFLDEIAWKFLNITFDMYFDEKFRFWLKRDAQREKGKWRCPCLRSSTGGRRTEVLTGALFLCCFYGASFIDVVNALDTSILPAARELCSNWRWLHHETESVIGEFQALFLRLQVVLIGWFHDPTGDFERYANPAHGGMCSAEFHVVTVREGLLVAYRHLHVTIAFACVLFSLLFLTRLLHWLRLGRPYPEEDLREIRNAFRELEDA
mmetsp:Transcript_44626/g.123674  ORF Transcript_44626/g.123674 Transcript_44626/m.123674 type:complete len:412 (-) Transcript_44626:305-1540(-)